MTSARKLLIATALALVVTGEIAARIFGLVDVPLYDANNYIGYVPKPNQRGSFMLQNDWEFNAYSMGAKAFASSSRNGTLLVGDSIVLGGNPYKAEDRIGPQLARVSGASVWPISAGSWTLLNELHWLEINQPVVRQIDEIIFVLNNGDFGPPSSWACDRTHPRRKPDFALWYLLDRYVLQIEDCTRIRPENLVPTEDLEAALHAFLRSTDKRVTVVLYPDKAESLDRARWRQATAPHIALLRRAGVARIIDVMDDPRWSHDYYRDGIHPTSQGYAVLAKIISDGDR